MLIVLSLDPAAWGEVSKLYERNKLFWKEVNEVKKKNKGMEIKVKDVNGAIPVEDEKVQIEYFEQLLDVERRKAEISTLVMEVRESRRVPDSTDVRVKDVWYFLNIEV